MNILSHTAVKEGKNMRHEAIVETTENIDNEEEFVEEVAVKVGYHPAGYDCKNHKVESLEKNKFRVKWKSYANCE